jgi:hypothetical protein
MITFPVELTFQARVIYWRGPSPFFYAPLPPEPAAAVREVANIVTYGWGMIPVTVDIGETRFTTALFAKEGTYYLPLKVAVRRAAAITAGDLITVEMTIQPPG